MVTPLTIRTSFPCSDSTSSLYSSVAVDAKNVESSTGTPLSVEVSPLSSDSTATTPSSCYVVDGKLVESSVVLPLTDGASTASSSSTSVAPASLSECDVRQPVGDRAL